MGKVTVEDELSLDSAECEASIVALDASSHQATSASVEGEHGQTAGLDRLDKRELTTLFEPLAEGLDAAMHQLSQVCV
jgi:hypothetical protein